jgi:hypothetical protein
LAARGVAKEGTVSGGGIEAACGVALKRTYPQTGVTLLAAATPARESKKISAAIRIK